MTENKMEIVAGKCPIEAGGNCPLRPQGKWLFTEIDENFHVYGQCSVCKERNRIGKACRSCGAEMKGGAE